MDHVNLDLRNKVTLQGYFLRKKDLGNEGSYVLGVCGRTWPLSR